MKKKIMYFFAYVCAFVILASAFATFAGCSKKDEEFLSTNKINGLADAIADNALYIEWLNTFDKNLPTVIVFHGEESENSKFTVDLDKNAYGKEVTRFSDEINENTIGINAQGLKNAVDPNYYNIAYYWTNTAKFNVAIFHWEKFTADETTDDLLTKILTSYKSRYKLNGNEKECNFGYSLAEVVAAMIYEELSTVGVSGKEIRFVGNGIGANLALAVDAYLTNAYGKEKIADVYLPSRLTLCDPYLGTEALKYQVSFVDGVVADKGALGAVNSLIKNVTVYSAAVEIIESLEVNGEARTYAYSTEKTEEGDAIFNEIKANSAYLLLAEKYSTAECYSFYKLKKRIAFDWYMYSIIGSDDSFTRAIGVGTYPTGYPHEYLDHIVHTDNNTTNWGNNHTRPILNNRAVSNDYNSGAGATRGFNFAIGAWTPTEYIRALRGISFLQKKSIGQSGNSDVNGTVIFNYEEYVLPTFRSENYQVSTQTDYTVICGYVYIDANKNNVIDDGAFNTLANSKFKVKVKNSTNSKIYVNDVIMYSDNNGFYSIRINDSENAVKTLNITALPNVDNGMTINGLCCVVDGITIELEYVCKRGYTAKASASKNSFYTAINGNNFDKSILSVSISADYTHGMIIRNCLVKTEE